jgi:hypothetical protein
MNIEQLRTALRSPETVSAQAFTIVRNIAQLHGDPDHRAIAHEFVLRALEHRDRFGSSEQILTALAREVGLFPYLKPESLGLKDSVAYEFHRPINMGSEFVFHREQGEVYRRLLAGESVILSAPTSFGKSRIVDALIASGQYENIAIIVPTLALIDETRRRLSDFSDQYKLVTHLSQKPGKKTIFVFTAERAVSYESFGKVQFFVIDEFYKLGALSEDTSRTVALNQAFYKLKRGGAQFYLLGPSIERIPEGIERAYRCYFYPTTYTTVASEQIRVPGRDQDAIERLVTLCKGLHEPTLVFCRSPARVNEVARALIASAGISHALKPAADWVAKHFHSDWVFRSALEHGIGMHHGKIPRSLAQYVVRMFNSFGLRFLVCTSTLIEGVNTKAKNVVVFDHKIARQNIDFFTFNNIRGRSGRMFEHFVGNVYLFHEPPNEQLPFVDFPLFTQDANTPTSLLLQMDVEDLSPGAQDRLRRYSEQNVLPVRIMRENASIDPEAQLAVARELLDSPLESLRELAWTGLPSYAELLRTCDLIWKHLVQKRGLGAVRSAAQLAVKLMQLSKQPSVRTRVLQELQPGPYAADSPDEAVERVLDFDRSWAGYEFPRCLMAVSRIQSVVLPRRGLKPGEYTHYASMSEALFQSPVVAALDEYGVPTQVGRRLIAALGTSDDLDLALTKFGSLDVSNLRLDPFEVEIVLDAQRNL